MNNTKKREKQKHLINLLNEQNCDTCTAVSVSVFTRLINIKMEFGELLHCRLLLKHVTSCGFLLGSSHCIVNEF